MLVIPEVWLVDLEAERVDVCREPRPTCYGSRNVAGRGEQASVEALPDARVLVEEILR